MHRFMLDHLTGTACEGIWFTGGAVAVFDFDKRSIRTFSSMINLQESYPDLELRWLDNADEYWDAQDLAVRSSLRDWTYEGPSLTLSPIVDNVN